MSATVYDVAVNGRVIESAETRDAADALCASNPGSQIRTRAESRTVPAAFAVFVDGTQVGETMNDAGDAAKAAKKAGGMIKMVAAT